MATRWTVALAFAVAAGAFAAGATAATWSVWEGAPGKTPKGVAKEASLNQFLPSALSIRAGDSIRFRSNEFHTATVLGSHTVAEFPLAIPSPAGDKYAAMNDAAGAPFFFGGLPKFIYNPNVFGPVGTTTVDDNEIHSSGPFGKSIGRPEVTFAFPKTGTFTVLCLIHPGMKMTLKVKAARVQKAKAVAVAVKKQLAKAWKTAKALAKQAPPADTVWAGNGGNPTLLAFLPKQLTIKAGTTVTFANHSASEVHDMVWGPDDYVDAFFKATDLLPQGPGSPNQVMPPFVFGSEPAPAGYRYDGTNHGNGFLITPLMDLNPASPLPDSVKVTFTKPGTYKYFCGIHGSDMSGAIVVTP